MSILVSVALTASPLVGAVDAVDAVDEVDEVDEVDADNGDNGALTVCERSANKMFRSCRFEVKEELNATNAKCINQVDPDDPTKSECLEMAKETYQEDLEGCSNQKEARKDVCELLGENRYGPEGLLATGNFVEEPDGSNPYFSLQPGRTYVARAGEGFEETIVVTVTDHVREVLGVNCRLVVDIVLVKEDDEYIPVEVTDDYYAQEKETHDVHYCGEVARNFEDGVLVNLDGSFEAGRDLAKSGILIKANPHTGDAHRQEYLLGEAEDVIQYVAGVGDETVPGGNEGGEGPISCESNGGCVKTEEFIPPEPGTGEFKYFLAGTGFVLGVALEDGVPTGERDEVLCTGDKLDVLGDPSCGFEEDLRAQLCDLSTAFCVEE
jgi:hypothetical protein